MREPVTMMTISNLFPRPDRPALGMFNAQLFESLGRMISIENICLVPEWRFWRRPAIRQWRCAAPTSFPTRYEPVFFVPGVGRDWAGALYARSLRHRADDVRRAGGVLATWLYPDGVAAARLARDCGVPCWILVQGSDTFHLSHARRRAAILEAARWTVGFICVSRILAERLIEAGIPRIQVHVVSNGVDARRFHYRPATDAWQALPREGSRGPARKTVLYVGNLVSVKGPDVLIEAWKRLRMHHPPHSGGAPRLVLLGDGPMRKGLERRVREEGLAESVEFSGVRPHEEIALWMNGADVLCLSSRSEGMPNVVLEALASGLPVVATDVGACREMLAGESASRVVPADDAAALAAGISELLAMEVDRAVLAARHGKRSWDAMAQDVVDVLRQAGANL